MNALAFFLTLAFVVVPSAVALLACCAAAYWREEAEELNREGDQ